ncbi:antibiotic biosynthesis monooxygenase [Pontibacter sp. G13]|uniref:putative quinol monooxygenase n=1 Tax=Pontibacter sp. G13 TaxID=3074898 RepID=UPI00288A8124|nr:antibiotic biosynthesis monooxygenase [Pontibacter sp. G13]WNJ19353.1 antibiotic biosynthesis monooxygenase [Pontibacter sp. G13]
MSDNIIWTVAGRIKDGQRPAFDALMEEMVETVRKEPGTINYEWTIGQDNRTLQVYERYKDAQAAETHLPTWGSFSGRFTEVVDITGFVVYCDLPDNLREAVAGLNPVYMTPIGGFAKNGTGATGN